MVDADLIEIARKCALYYDDLAKSPEPTLNPGMADELNALFKEMIIQLI